MKIIYRKGDLLQQVNIQVIGHQCNCFNSFGKGLARQIKEQYPESYHVDCSTIKGDMNKLGTFSITKNTTPLVANIYSQYYYGTNQIQTNYGALELSLDKLGNYMILLTKKW